MSETGLKATAPYRQHLSRTLPFAFHTLSFLANRSAPFIAAFVAARLLGVDEFGRFAAAVGVFMTATLVVDLGFAVSTIHNVAKGRDAGCRQQYRTALVALILCLTASGILGVIIAFVHTDLAALIFNSAAMVEPLAAGALFVPAAAVFAIATGVLQGMRRFAVLAAAGICGTAIHVTLVAMAALHGDAVLALWAAATGMAVRAAAVALPLARGLVLAAQDLWTAGAKSEAASLVRTAIPASVASLVFAPVNAVLLATLFRSEGGAAEAGAFGVGLQLFAALSLVPTIVTQYTLPTLSTMADHRRRKRTALAFSGVSFAVTVCAAGLVLLAGNPLLALLGEDYRPFAPAFALMVLAAAASAPHGALSNYLLASEHHWQRVAVRYFWGACVLGAFWLAPRDAVGAALAYLLGWALAFAPFFAMAIRVRPHPAPPIASALSARQMKRPS